MRLYSQATGNSVFVDLLAASIPDGNLGGAASGNPGGTPFSATLAGVPAGDLLSVIGLTVNGQDSQIPGGQSGFLDNFSVTLIPEPATALLASLAAIGFVRMLPHCRTIVRALGEGLPTSPWARPQVSSEVPSRLPLLGDLRSAKGRAGDPRTAV